MGATTARHVYETDPGTPATRDSPAAAAIAAGVRAANAPSAGFTRRSSRALRVVRVAYLRLCRALGGVRACARYRGV